MTHLAATPADFAAAGRLLHDFNTEFDDPSPGAESLAARVAELVASGATEVLLGTAPEAAGEAGEAGEPGEAGEIAAVAVLRYRPSLWSSADECYLAELYVVPDRRGSGLGRTLLRACVEQARERGCDFIDLSTSEDDVAARHLYEAEGFRRTDGDGGPITFHYEMDL
jgi:ribosomal protein S18 acetylase RimI-like enzyme